MSKTQTKILDVAEAMIKEGGYHAFSFRQIADAIGIKSASVHYHFPAKEALGAAVAQRYSERFMDALGKPEECKVALPHYVSLFQQALASDGRTCLCGVLAAEAGRLPESVQTIIKEFADGNRIWLASMIRRKHPDWSPKRVDELALMVFSAMEGAMSFAALSSDPSKLDRVGNALNALL